MNYLARIRELPCCICEAFGEEQTTLTQAHHTFHDRFSRSKVDDALAIPLCDGHHLGNRDTSKLAIHREKARWRKEYGADTDYIAETQDKILE